jgi:hypothetical protein
VFFSEVLFGPFTTLLDLDRPLSKMSSLPGPKLRGFSRLLQINLSAIEAVHPLAAPSATVHPLNGTRLGEGRSAQSWGLFVFWQKKLVIPSDFEVIEVGCHLV